MLKDFLRGFRVLDLSQFLPGPVATQILADMGADVLKVEPPARDPMRCVDPMGGTTESSPYYQVVNAGKAVVVLDLKTPEGKAALRFLIAAADVLLESYRPGVLDRLGFGHDDLRALNPRLVHCALSGYGQTGPYRLTAGHDLNYVAMTGALNVSGTAETPVMAWPPVADHASAMQAAMTTLGALVARQRTGRGSFIDVSLAETVLGWQGWGLTGALGGGPGPVRAGNVLNGGAAYYQIYRTADGRFVTLGAIEAKFWANFCTAVGRPEWISRQGDPLPQTGLVAEVRALFAGRTRDEWDALLSPVDCCYHAVMAYGEVPEHPQVLARGLLRRDGDGTVTEVLLPAFVDGAPPAARLPLREVDVETALAAWGADLRLAADDV